MSELLWVAVPNGLTEGGQGRWARLRVLIVPRLRADSLAAAGMADWPPPALETARLAVDFAPATDRHPYTVTVDPPHIQAQPRVWQALFGPPMTVKPFQPHTETPPVEGHATLAQ